MASSRLRKFNNGLTFVSILLALYIIAIPFLPVIGLWFQNTTNSKPPLVLANIGEQAEKSDEPIPDDNTLVIPAINLQEVAHEGQTAAALSLGIWRRPQTSTPDKGGNTVLVGHRFSYSDPAVLYHLDRVNEGDPIVLYWEGKKYQYQVERKLIVPPSAIEIEAPTDEPMLTVYTCTPLWSARDRLVLQARLLE
jgi:sortase A